jgi:fucose 4-O-acetylase-like acetyltransferase
VLGKRIQYLDLAKGFCIILVVFYHTKGIVHRDYWLDPFLSAFRLPLYFLLSGLFFRDYGGFRHFLTKKANRLLVPFLAFYLLTAVLLPNVLHLVFGIEFETVTGMASLWAFIWPGEYPNIPIWFLWCLFLMNVLFWLIHRVAHHWSDGQDNARAVSMIIATCLVCGFIGHLLLSAFPTDVGNVFKALASMPFFCAGYLLGRFDGLSALQNLSWIGVIVLFCLLLGICIFSLQTSASSLLTFLFSLVAGVTGAMMMVLLARMLGCVLFISYIGRYSIILLLTHGLLVRVLSPLCRSLASVLSADGAIFVVTLLILLSYLVIIPFCRRYLPHITAQKPLFTEFPK